MERLSFKARPTSSNVIYETDSFRVMVLTPCLLRVEAGAKTDLPTQTVWNRDLGPVSHTVEVTENSIIVQTEEVVFCLDIKQGEVTSITLADGTIVTDFCQYNLLGTARTLDYVNGAVELELGIMSRSGASVMDDSKSLLLLPDGTIQFRPVCQDRYYFAYGHNYLRQLKDFYQLTGPVPLIPKYALGNWWSRYRAYTQEEYQRLMESFIERRLPITVATIDMDWHWTDVVERFGKDAMPEEPKCKEEVYFNKSLPGWTGYSWNTDLFPDHRALLQWLHENGFHVTLNIHPSQGIRYFENCYRDVCLRMGKNPEDKELIPFDITSKMFREAYFEEVHHPMEDEGVDFWWLDWQQGTKTKIEGLDPLWALNHYHTLDKARDGKRPLILSRFAGLGSHRYPLGFSGDTQMTWKCLDFQPYFTNTAANAGYTWWSHDIGGHIKGFQDDELYLRWLQYGVFSPINRLHSSNSEFIGKEPWKRSWAVAKIAEFFLRLRHKLVPFLYSANYQTHSNGTPICMPLYYRYDCNDAYEAKNQYIFGGQLLVCPVTEPANKRLNLAPVKAWLPEGRWTDIFNGRIYKGGRWTTLFRDLDSIPVLAGEGTIVPMYHDGDSNNLSLHQPLDIHIWRGDGSFTLYEDDGETTAYEQGVCAITSFNIQLQDDSLIFSITPPENSCGLLPEHRQMYLRFRDVLAAEVYVDSNVTAFTDAICVTVSNKPVTIKLNRIKVAKNQSLAESRENLLTRVQGSNDWKDRIFQQKESNYPRYVQEALGEFDALDYEC